MKQNKKRVGKMVMTAVLLILGGANIFPFIFQTIERNICLSGEADTGTLYYK